MGVGGVSNKVTHYHLERGDREKGIGLTVKHRDRKRGETRVRTIFSMRKETGGIKYGAEKCSKKRGTKIRKSN